MTKKSKLGIQWVLRKFAKLAPAKNARIVPKNTYIKTINKPYKNARRFPPCFFVKKLTVIGIKGYTQGVNRANNPAPKATKKNSINPPPVTSEAFFFESSEAEILKLPFTGTHKPLSFEHA